MRFTRILLVIVAAAAIAGVAVPAANALTFTDDSCQVQTGGTIKVCPAGETGKAYSFQLQGRPGTGCVPFVKFTISGGDTPPGISLSSSGLLSGTPTQSGQYDFWVTMQDQLGGGGWCADTKSTERQFEITVVQGLQIVQTQARLTPGQLTQPYSLQFSANGGGSPTWAVASGALPAGLSLTAAGLLSGTPTAAGDYSFQIKVADGSRSDTQTYSITVVEPLKINAKAPSGELGKAYSLQLAAGGGRSPYAWTASNLPAGLSLDQASGIVSGSPTSPGNAVVHVVVTDALGLTTAVDLPLAVAAHLAFAGTPLRHAKVAARYTGRFAVVGGVAPRTFRIVHGSLPAGLRLNAKTGALSGSPRSAGTFRLSVRVTDALRVVATRTFVLKVS
jgi:large repetitive protein